MTLTLQNRNTSFFGRSRWIAIITVLGLLAGGLMLRFTNFTAPPLDVHAWRQLRSASIARQMFYDVKPGVEENLRASAHYLGVVFGTLEPPLFERLVAQTYLLAGQELLWVARLYSIIFWMILSMMVFLLAWQMLSFDGAVVALAFMLFLPFGNTFSRTFLPEPLYMMCMWLGLFAFYQWVEKGGWLWAVLAGATIGISILVKVFSAFMLIPAVALYLITRRGFKAVLKDARFYVFVALSAVIPAVYYLWLIPGQSSDYLQVWSLPYLHLLKDPVFYLRWLQWLGALFNPVVLLLAGVSVLLWRHPARWLLVGLWVGYVIFGFTLPSLITSHNYYSLPLVPILGLSLAALGDELLMRVRQQKWLWQVGLIAILLVGLGLATYQARKEIRAEDYQAQAQYWVDLSKKLPNDGKYVGLLADYSTRMIYYGWRFVGQYPFSYDLDMAVMGGKSFDFEKQGMEFFRSKTDGYDYFLITELEELDRQPYLNAILTNYFPVVAMEKDYILYDLRKPLKPLPK